MKANLLSLVVCVILLGIGNAASGQEVSINLFGGYTFQDKVNFDTGYGEIEDGGHWGGSIEVALQEYAHVELLYQRMDTRAVLYGPLSTQSGDLGINYIMLGSVKYLNTVSGPVAPFGGISGGVGIFEGKDFGRSNEVRFSFGLKLGILIAASEKVGIRIQAQMLSPVQGAGGGFYFGTGGTGAGVSTYSSIYQFGFTGGLQYKLGQ